VHVATGRYLPRVVDGELSTRLQSSGAVLIEGPKGCGKTATALQRCASSVRLDTDLQARFAVTVDPSLVLEGPTPRLLDEWQVEPGLWNHVRRAIDDRQQSAQFILTGSAVPADDTTRHSGAGRISRLRMRPMSLFESGHSTGDVSLAAILVGGSVRATDSGLTIRMLADRICAGGWPGLLDHDVTVAAQRNRDYLEEICRTDVVAVDGVRRDPVKVRATLRSLARHVSTPATTVTIASDAGAGEGAVDRTTVTGYLHALARIHVLEDQPAWAPHLRSRSIVRTHPIRHFVDPSLATASMRVGPEPLLADLNLMSLMFESLVVRDLRVYAQTCDATVSHYRDSADLEVDAIVDDGNGTWAAFEIKLGTGAIDAGAATLRTFAGKVDTRRCGAPAALAVITATGYAYTRPDGVHVVPIGALRP
jgi:predicted AAA+ superfamily ATPase